MAVKPTTTSSLDKQVGGDHYKALGQYQPVEVLKRWLTPEEFRGYMKGTTIVYMAREMQKGGTQDIEKAKHTLELFLELTESSKNASLQRKPGRGSQT